MITDTVEDNQLSNNTSQTFKSKFSKTIIYRIFCKDISITDCYIGRTVNFKIRLSGHKTASRTSDLKIYRKIRKM